MRPRLVQGGDGGEDVAVTIMNGGWTVADIRSAPGGTTSLEFLFGTAPRALTNRSSRRSKAPKAPAPTLYRDLIERRPALVEEEAEAARTHHR
jgi:hypothetical protein